MVLGHWGYEYPQEGSCEMQNSVICFSDSASTAGILPQLQAMQMAIIINDEQLQLTYTAIGDWFRAGRHSISVVESEIPEDVQSHICESLSGVGLRVSFAQLSMFKYIYSMQIYLFVYL